MSRLGKPRLNVRTIKMALAAALCVAIYELCFEDRSPAFACIGAIFGMGENMED